MLINTVVWGAAFVFVKPSLSITTPFRFLLYRYILAVLLSLPILWHYRTYFKKVKSVLKVIIFTEALGTTFALALLYLGLEKTSAIEANLLTSTTPILMTIASIWFLKEKEEKNEALGLLLAATGSILLVIIPILIKGEFLGFTSVIGNMLIFFSMVINVIYLILIKKTYHHLPMFLISSLSFYVGLISFLFLSIAESNFSATQLAGAVMTDITHPEVWLAAIYMAFLGSIIGLTAYYKGQDGIEASEASLFTYLQPIIAIPLGILILKEHIYSLQLVAIVIIILGVLIAETRKRKKHVKRN